MLRSTISKRRRGCLEVHLWRLLLRIRQMVNLTSKERNYCKQSQGKLFNWRIEEDLRFSSKVQEDLTRWILYVHLCYSQPSDSFGFDGGGGMEDEKLDLLFAPAKPAVVKKTKGNKVVLGKDKTAKRSSSNQSRKSSSKTSNETSTPRSSSNNSFRTPEQQQHRRYSPSPSSSSKSTPTKSPPADTGTPPLPTRKHIMKDGLVMVEEDDVWYKEWWMSCFPDAFKNLMPTK